MSVVVEIKGKTNFKNLVNDEIDYGVKDTAYRLNKASEDSKVVVFYNKKSLGRGIEVEQENKTVCVRLNSSSTRDDVNLFYYLIKKICEENNQTTFRREGEKCDVSKIDEVLLPEEQNDNMHTFETTKFMIEKMGGRIDIFGARNPISLDENILNHLNNDFYEYEDYICSIQKAYEYYSAPIVLGDDKKNYGIFTLHPNVVTVVPIEPILNLADAPEDYKIDEWFIGNETGLIKYSNFIKQFDDSPLYDANHIIIKLSEEEFSDLVSKYGEDL